MRNVGATWEQIVALARSLDVRARTEPEVEDPVVLAKLVLEFHRTVVAQPVKRAIALPERSAPARGEAAPPADSGSEAAA